MNESDEELRELLRAAFGPAPDGELREDLWPRMLRRMSEHRMRAARWDWALVALLVAGCYLFPGAVLTVLYHL